MPWKFNAFTLQLDYYKDDKYAIVSHDTDTILVASDLKKFHIMDTSGGERTFTLPPATVEYIGYWIGVSRKDKTKSLLRIYSDGSDIIFNCPIGGYLECADTDHNYCTQVLMIIEEGAWSNPSFGVWSSH